MNIKRMAALPFALLLLVGLLSGCGTTVSLAPSRWRRPCWAKAPCCGEACTPESMAEAEAAKAAAGIKVLGSGCAKCNALETAVHSALEELGMDAAIDHVTDFGQIAAYGVMSTPALVVDGKVLSKDEAKALIQKERG